MKFPGKDPEFKLVLDITGGVKNSLPSGEKTLR